MKTLKELLELRAGKVSEQATLVDTAEKENREFSESEAAEFDKLQKAIDDLKPHIARAKQIEAAKKARAEAEGRDITPPKKEEDKIREKYRFTKVLHARSQGKDLTGLEKEMHEEAIREAAECGTSVKGVGVPSMLMDQRNLEVATASAGGDTVATNLGPLIPALRPRLKTRELGIQVMTGLRGNLDLPRHTGLVTAKWEGEKTSAKESNPTFDKISFKPKRLAAFSRFTLQLLNQTSIGVEMLVRNELSDGVGRAVDLAVINGDGVNAPKGILQLANLGIVSNGDNGGKPVRSKFIEMETKIANENADIGQMAFLTTPGLRGLLKDTKVDAGSGLFLWKDNNQLIGYNAEVSTMIPKDLTKGTGTDLNAIIFGYWREYVLGQWGGFDLIVDPYTEATEGMIKVVTNTFWDGDALHDQSFSAMKDASLV